MVGWWKRMRTMTARQGRCVGVAVSGSGEPVPVGGAGRCGDRAGAAELGEGWVGADPLGVVAEHDGHLGCGVRADPEPVSQAGRVGSGGLVEDAVVIGDLSVKRCPAPRQGTAGRAWRTRPA